MSFGSLGNRGVLKTSWPGSKRGRSWSYGGLPPGTRAANLRVTSTLVELVLTGALRRAIFVETSMIRLLRILPVVVLVLSVALVAATAAQAGKGDAEALIGKAAPAI